MSERDERDDDEPDSGADSTPRRNDDHPTSPVPADHGWSEQPTAAADCDQKLFQKALDDTFDLSVLTKSSTPGSMGRLGKYEALAIIGRGGMGVVLKAFDESLGRNVAIKVMSRQLAASSTARRRFTREARAVAAVSHPNVITIHAVDEQGGLPYFVMEYADGGSLQDKIKKQAPLPLADVLRIGSQVAVGLAAAHAQGIVHRDIKPANIMLEHDVDRVKITDFGLARVTLDNVDLTSQGNQIGTPSYMSPEQVHGHAVDDRSDLFSLGCVLYAMIAGQSPFRGTHAFDSARRILESKTTPLVDFCDDVPPFLSTLVDKLLEKDPKQRYQSASEVARVLNHYLTRMNQARTDELPGLMEETLAFRSGASSNRHRYIIAGLLTLVIGIAATTPLWLDGDRADNQTRDTGTVDNAKSRPAPMLSPDSPVDLLTTIDLDANVVAGNGWACRDGRLITGIGRGARLQIPYPEISKYQLDVVATRRERTGPLAIGLMIEGSQCYVLLDALRANGDRLSLIGVGRDGKTVLVREGIHLPQNETTQIVCRVTPSSLNVTVADKEVFDWTGESSELKLGAGWNIPNREAFFIGSNDDAVFEITKMRLSFLAD